MSFFISDTFTDTTGTSLDSHTPDIGGPATKVTSETGTAQITAAGRLRAATAATSIGYQYAGAPSAGDYDVLCDIYIASLTTDASAAGPMARIQSGAQTFYWGYLINDPQRGSGAFQGYALYKYVAGTASLLGQSSNITLTAGSTVKLKLSLRGTAITLYVSTNGGVSYTAVCAATDSSITTGSAGIGFYAQTAPTDSTGVHVDNLSAASTVTIAPNNTAWVSSPGNWVVSSSSAISTDFGAKRTIVVSGTPSASLTFDLSALTAAAIATADYPQIRCTIDNGPTTDATISASVSVMGYASTGNHEITYEFLRGNYNIDAYTTPVMAIRETGLVLGIAGTVSSPTDLEPDLMFVTGDSITAGLAMLSPSNPAGVDATATFAKALGPALGAEVGVCGRSGVGWTFAAAGNVPAFPTEWKNAWSGQARSFPTLKRMIAVIGTNDALNSLPDSPVTSAVTSWLTDARATLGSSTWIHVVIPFGGFKRSSIAAGVADYLATHHGQRVDCIDLGTFIQAGLSGPSETPTRESPSDGIHPSMTSHGQLGAALATAIHAAETALSFIGILQSNHNVGGGLLAGL